jgi:hypothetical protein
MCLSIFVIVIGLQKLAHDVKYRAVFKLYNFVLRAFRCDD